MFYELLEIGSLSSGFCCRIFGNIDFIYKFMNFTFRSRRSILIYIACITEKNVLNQLRSNILHYIYNYQQLQHSEIHTSVKKSSFKYRIVKVSMQWRYWNIRCRKLVQCSFKYVLTSMILLISIKKIAITNITKHLELLGKI